MAITVEHLSFSYGQAPILKDISLDLPKGKFISLIGPNGSGKSTLLKAMLALKKPQTGITTIDGKALQRLSAKDRAKRVAFLPQNPEIHEDILVKDFVALGRYHSKRFFKGLTSKDQALIAQAIRWSGLEDLEETSLLSLSGGQRQRAFIAMILAQDTDYIFLDEPTSYLDVNHQIELIEILKDLQENLGKTIVMVLHDLPLVSKYSDYIVALKDGQLYDAGTPSQVFTDKMLAQVFQVCATICPIKNSSQVLCYDFRKNK